MIFKKVVNRFARVLGSEGHINPMELYKYSIFFRNYIENSVEDALRPGIYLEYLGVGFNVDLRLLGLELSDALLEAMISYRFNGAGYILIKPKSLDEDLSRGVNDELPVGFKYLDYRRLRDDRDNDCIQYLRDDGESIVIHKSRVIIYENFDYILGAHAPVYTQSLLLDICLLEQIYIEIEKRIEQYNFLFYKDEQLVSLMESLSSARSQVTGFKGRGLFATFFKSNDREDSIGDGVSGAGGSELDRTLSRLRDSLGNDGIFYSADGSARLEVIKYDLTFLKEAFELIRAKIGADTKEPLTRSFNEQVKGLGSDGKGDRSNYIDFLGTVQESAALAVNMKLNKHYRLNMKFNDLLILSDEQKLERDLKLLDAYSKYLELIKHNSLSGDEIETLRRKLNFSF
ncbi:phage portal protein (plasmid) [Candidatus Borreliella tachyglossi]|uniref:Phage portal protein n=1 Tax=Candidatus Borreliella tachyglossi TaxID=1964448 RepID=A0A2S1LYD4_9SPIR|nr:anti-CBASS Acb1 family protein [Candidatus Borreliella tachyglossi]AWG43292.1 phage portal protein [Candidatus Borreliella tachyglossi]